MLGDEHHAHVSCLLHSQISDRSARATSPCAATAATAARTKAAVTAAGSEDSQRQPTNINLLCFLSYPRK